MICPVVLMTDVGFELVELQRLLGNIIRIGRIEQVDYQETVPVCRVRFGNILTGWLPVMALRAGPDSCWWPLETGEQVIVLAPCGDLSQGVVLGAIHQQLFPSRLSRPDIHQVNYADGAIVSYDRAAHHLFALLPGGGKTTLVSDGGITITGDVTVTGNITASGEITDHTRSMQADRDIFNSHTHGGIAGGPGHTLVPDQSQ